MSGINQCILRVIYNKYTGYISMTSDSKTIGRQFDNNATEIVILRPGDGSLDSYKLTMNFQTGYSKRLPGVYLGLTNFYNLSSNYTQGSWLSIQLEFTDASGNNCLRTNQLRFSLTPSLTGFNPKVEFTMTDKDKLDSIEQGAEVNAVNSVNGMVGDVEIEGIVSDSPTPQNLNSDLTFMIGNSIMYGDNLLLSGSKEQVVNNGVSEGIIHYVNYTNEQITEDPDLLDRLTPLLQEYIVSTIDNTYYKYNTETSKWEQYEIEDGSIIYTTAEFGNSTNDTIINSHSDVRANVGGVVKELGYKNEIQGMMVPELPIEDGEYSLTIKVTSEGNSFEWIKSSSEDGNPESGNGETDTDESGNSNTDETDPDDKDNTESGNENTDNTDESDKNDSDEQGKLN